MKSRVLDILNFRKLCLATAVSCALLIAAAYYMEYALFLEPCPLCMVQRVLVLIVGLVCLAAAAHFPQRRGRIIYATCVAFFAALGMAAAGRHVWLQNLPQDRIPECFPGIGFIVSNHPFMESMRIIFGGTGECAETLWTFLGISIPGWTLIAFIVFCGTALAMIYGAQRTATETAGTAAG